MSLRSTSRAPVVFDALVTPVARKGLRRDRVLRAQMAFSTGCKRQIEKPLRLPEGVGMRPAHEAVADEPDIQRSSSPSLIPSMRIADVGHHAEDVAPRLLLHHRLRSGTCSRPSRCAASRASAVPALVAQPVAGIVDDVQLAVGIVRQAVTAGLVVRARSLHRRRRSARRESRWSTAAAHRVTVFSAASSGSRSFQS